MCTSLECNESKQTHVSLIISYFCAGRYIQERSFERVSARDLRREATVLNIKQQDVLKVGITYTLTYLRDTYRHSSIDSDVAIFNTVSIHIDATTSVR